VGGASLVVLISLFLPWFGVSVLGESFSLSGTTAHGYLVIVVIVAVLMIAYLVLIATGIVMLVMWIGALIRLGQQHAWGWFVGVLVLHLIGLGIIGMVAYAVAGPPDTDRVVTRPTTPV